MNAYPVPVKRLDQSPNDGACSFLAQVRGRIASGASLRAVGRELGVSKQSVHQWLTGATSPSGVVLALASLLWRAPVDLAPGLPDGDRPAGG